MQQPTLTTRLRRRGRSPAAAGLGLGLLITALGLLPAHLRAAAIEGKPVTLQEVGNLKLRPIAAGNFLMGRTQGDRGEKPATGVTLTQPYWLGATEVTQGQWSAVMGNNPSHFKGSNLPVESVTYSDGSSSPVRAGREGRSGRLFQRRNTAPARLREAAFDGLF